MSVGPSELEVIEAVGTREGGMPSMVALPDNLSVGQWRTPATPWR